MRSIYAEEIFYGEGEKVKDLKVISIDTIRSVKIMLNSGSFTKKDIKNYYENQVNLIAKRLQNEV